MKGLVISTLVLTTLVGFAISLTPEEIQKAAAAGLPLTGTITQGPGNTICCTVETLPYICQDKTFALGPGGLIGSLNLGPLLCGLLGNVVDPLVGTDTINLVQCVNQKAPSVTCTPPTVPAGTTPITPTSDFCKTQCTSGECCTAKGC